MEKFVVELTSCGNPDRGQNPYEPVFGVPSMMVCVDSIEVAQKVVRSYIEEYILGGGNWAGGKVWNDNGEEIGYISYNGRFWDKEPK